ncbi:MAG: prepilin-type N-terminal cleavage/methylation domain-containing protein, partial [Synergistaceae bacterium]|nr:prepilin-type N-terminal cleavage/methylation domain-containing protein [Synergistaceae bacterium]
MTVGWGTISGEAASDRHAVSRGRCGSSLVEMLIAIMMLAVVLLGIMAGVTIARSAVYDKEFENARQIAMGVI